MGIKEKGQRGRTTGRVYVPHEMEVKCMVPRSKMVIKSILSSLELLCEPHQLSFPKAKKRQQPPQSLLSPHSLNGQNGGNTARDFI